jgi:cyclopropane-fatty-acyl-phospholipid synthase
MNTITDRDLVEELLGSAGVRVNGSNPWDIRVNDERFFRRVLADGELGFGESYMDGWWDADRVDELVVRIMLAGLNTGVGRSWSIAARIAMARLTNRQSRRHAFVVGERHYDLGNDLFSCMLDRRMNYSCAYWKDADSLDEAQERKLDLLCRKLALRPGMRVLDIGCGWGAFGRYAAERYDVQVVGITVSREQAELGRTLCEGLPVEFRLTDYRDLRESFDRIVSVGMFEHVGPRNYRTYFEVAGKSLAEGGLFLLHTIGSSRSIKSIGRWTDRYIFPNGALPSIAQIGRALEGNFVMEDWHNLGAHYDRTLMSWHHKITVNWEKLQARYDERFRRMWTYYLLSSAGSFRARNLQVWQLVLSRTGVPGGYERIT